MFVFGGFLFDYVRNEFIAAFVCGGDKAMQFCVDARGASDALQSIAEDVREKCGQERDFIKSRQVETLEEYWDRWAQNPGIWK